MQTDFHVPYSLQYANMSYFVDGMEHHNMEQLKNCYTGVIALISCMSKLLIFQKM